MTRLLPRNLPAQLAVVMAGALLIASVVNFVIVFGERHRAVFIESATGVIARFSEAAYDVASGPLPPSGPEQIERTRRSRYQVGNSNIVDALGLHRDADLERRLVASLEENGVPEPAVRAFTRAVGEPDDTSRRIIALMQQDVPRTTATALPAADDTPSFEILLAMQLPDGRWYNGMAYQPETVLGDAALIGASTVITFLFVLLAALWMVARVARPLRDLAAAASRVGDVAEPQLVASSGPGDVQQTIQAFNAMSKRVSHLLREKDVMLGALAHDLRTPLASLRIRLETMEPEAERLKAIRTIEETSELLEDILELSRQGKSREPERATDTSVIVADLVEDYQEAGVKVALGDCLRAVATCRPILLRRALRNLIDNALAYAGNARVSVETSQDAISIHVDDDGPGMSAEALATAKEPFVRGEGSRSRSTGGAGLGLTLSDAIARAHGGALTLANRTPRGLRASLTLPAYAAS